MRWPSRGQSSDVWHCFAFTGSTILHMLLWILLASGMGCSVVWQTWTSQSLTSQLHISRQVNITVKDKLVYYKTTA